MKAELRGLPKDLAATVAAHIWAAGQYIDTDPALAFRHAEAARRRAGRLPIVREAAAETAYAAGEFAVALREFRAIRRMSGGDELIPLIADCERALGRHHEALDVLNELNPKHPDVNLHIECLLVEAGIRDDLGQRDEALRLLRAAISRKVGPPQAQARLQYALANLLEESGDSAAAREWFTSASELDRSGDLDIAERLAEIDGITLPDFTEEEDDEDESEEDESEEDLDRDGRDADEFDDEDDLEEDEDDDLDDDDLDDDDDDDGEDDLDDDGEDDLEDDDLDDDDLDDDDADDDEEDDLDDDGEDGPEDDEELEVVEAGGHFESESQPEDDDDLEEQDFAAVEAPAVGDDPESVDSTDVTTEDATPGDVTVDTDGLPGGVDEPVTDTLGEPTTEETER
ncbi:tetratricopeptide repeat protein [Tessaracoccus sp. MC1865]|uniref:tetratricopeptide repeat protein n=1 Tax=Tessaracoccus sp. MC1865 TaxID=2760310 RepID=UPI00160234AB|nr:tetratricopeptide repeat protein [Tessaracoccus sp. MC1865]MBB1484957.1 tetratricopeptide repeat protein [Tessaracoccus sp. MC1865]QTO38612.1 tetratricopeptide repeat protein [Tessaracoccus sp. MC1865]